MKYAWSASATSSRCGSVLSVPAIAAGDPRFKYHSRHHFTFFNCIFSDTTTIRMMYLSRYCHLFSKNKCLKTSIMGTFFSRVRRHRESAVHTASRVYSNSRVVNSRDSFGTRSGFDPIGLPNVLVVAIVWPPTVSRICLSFALLLCNHRR